MSLLQNDQSVAQGPRKDLGKEAKASLRDRIVDKLFDQLEEDGVGLKLQKAWSVSTANIQPVLDKQQVYLNTLDNFQVGQNTDSSKFGGVSNIHLPTVFTVVKTYHARFLSALLDIDPPFSMKARREDGTDRVAVAEDLMRYALASWANGYRGVDDEVDAWIWNWCTTGTGILKMRWLTTWETYLDVEDYKAPLPPLFQVDDQGNEVAIPQWEMKEREKLVTKKVFDGPQVDFVHLEDLRMVGGAGDPDLADIVMHRSWFNASELWTMADRGIFKADAVEAVIKGGPDSEAADASSGIKQQREYNVGVNSLDSEVDLDRYAIAEACFKHDVVGNGINSDIVAWIDLDTGKLLGATYLRRIMPSGERPYAVAHFHKRPGEEYGLGLLEILDPLAKELDAMHNIRIDNAIYQSIPFFFYRASSSLNPEMLQVEPGMGIPLDDPQRDVYFPNVGNRTSFTAAEENVIQSYIERLTGISDLSLGIMSGAQGAARTATGARALLGENNNNLSVHVRRLSRAWKKALRTVWHLLQTRVEPGFCFRVTGQDGEDVFRRVYDTDLALDVDFELNANSTNSNKSVQIEVAQQLVSMTMNPLNIQLGICTPNEAYAAQKNYLNQLGVKDVHRYLKRPAQYDYVLTPMEEFNRVVRLEDVPVSPASDHDGFIAFAQTMLDKQKDFTTLQPEQQSALIAQMRKHQDMKSALEQQAADAAVRQQMQVNATISGNQAPVALNTQAGANPAQLFN
jgi:hypothetical protein